MKIRYALRETMMNRGSMTIQIAIKILSLFT